MDNQQLRINKYYIERRDYYDLSNIEKNRIIASISAIRKKKTFKNICSLYNY